MLKFSFSSLLVLSQSHTVRGLYTTTRSASFFQKFEISWWHLLKLFNGNFFVHYGSLSSFLNRWLHFILLTVDFIQYQVNFSEVFSVLLNQTFQILMIYILSSVSWSLDYFFECANDLFILFDNVLLEVQILRVIKGIIHIKLFGLSILTAIRECFWMDVHSWSHWRWWLASFRVRL